MKNLEEIKEKLRSLQEKIKREYAENKKKKVI